MNVNQPDGGPAFPGAVECIPNASGGYLDLSEYGRSPHPGMSLRDYFAGQAMTALLQRGWIGDHADFGDGTPKRPRPYAESADDCDIEATDEIGRFSLASDAYEIADAMLFVRKKGK